MKSSQSPTVKQKMVDAIISAYHTTRLSETPVAVHILSKPYVQEAINDFLAARASPSREPGEDEVERVDIFEMGYAFGRALQGQALEDSRAVGRLLGCNFFEPIMPAIDAAIKELGFNSFEDADSGIAQAKAIIHRALSAPLTALQRLGQEFDASPSPANLESLAGAVSDDAIRHLQIRSPLNRAIYAALRDYRMHNMADEDGYGYPLVDLMSNPAPADIGTGEMEMVALADEIEIAITALTLPEQPRPVDDVERMREALETIARTGYGLQGILEDYGHDTNAYNFHAMKYWSGVALHFQKVARAALGHKDSLEEGDLK